MTKKTRNTKENRRKALDELGVDVPYYTCRVVGNRLEFSLYGGAVVTWPPMDPDDVGAGSPRPSPEAAEDD